MATKNIGVKILAELYVKTERANGIIDITNHFCCLNPLIKNQMPAVAKKVARDDSNEALVSWICQGEITNKKADANPAKLLLNKFLPKKNITRTVKVP